MPPHLLVDVDSKIPNLALLKISAWLKGQGKAVELVRLHGKWRQPERRLFDGVWVSAVFTWNRELAETYAAFYRSLGTEVRKGGTGISLTTRLPDAIEFGPVDYELYADDRAIGFVQRGCIRSCEFCVVPRKEGRLSENVYNRLEYWVPDGFSKVLLLDNEFAAMPYQAEVFATAKAHGWKLSITQGYDLRCVTAERAAMLADWKPRDLKFNEPRLYGAWDYFGIEPAVVKGIQVLVSAGFRPREIMVYCLAGYCTSHIQDYYRFHVLWKRLGVLPFIMRYNLRRDDPFLNALARYVNRGPAAYRNVSFPDFLRSRPGTWNLVDEAQGIVEHCESGRAVPMEIPYKMPAMKEWYS